MTRCIVDSESSDDHSFGNTSDGSASVPDENKLPQNVEFSMEVDKHYVMCFKSKQQQLEAQLKVYHAAMHVDKEKSQIIIIPCQGNEMIRDWESQCKTVINMYLKSLKIETLSIPPDKKDLMHSLIDCTIQTEKSLNIEYVEDSSLVIFAGDMNDVSRVKKMLEDAHKSIIEETVQIDDKKHFILINIKKDELLRNHLEVKVTINAANQSVTVFGFKEKCDEFISDLMKLKSKMQCVQVSVSNVLISFLSQKVGKDLLQYYLQGFQSEVATYFDTEENLYILGTSDSSVANDLATQIQDNLCHTSVPYPVLFQKSIESVAWANLSTALEGKHLIQISVIKNEIKLTGDSQMSSLAKKEIEQFINTECWSERCFQLCDAQWRLIKTHLNKKWKKLEHKIKKDRKIQFVVSSDSDDKNPCIILKGEKPTVAFLEKEIEAFLSLIVSSTNPIIQVRLGVLQYFCSDKGKAEVRQIESQQRSCVQIDVKKNVSNQSSSTSQCNKVSLGTTTEGKIITVYLGDITTLAVDVVVNVTNTTLKHTEGVALAIANKGGLCIQKDSDSYLQTAISIKEGDVFFAKNVGNLPCKSLIHAVSPKWKGGIANDMSIVSNLCIKALELAAANGFQTISLPVIGSGRNGFPASTSAKVMIEAVIKFSQSNPSSPISKIFFIMFHQHEADAFSKEMNQVFSTALVPKAANVTPIEDSYVIIDKTGATLASPPVAAYSQNIDVFQNIEVHKGNLLDYSVSLLHWCLVTYIHMHTVLCICT